MDDLKWRSLIEEDLVTEAATSRNVSHHSYAIHPLVHYHLKRRALPQKQATVCFLLSVLVFETTSAKSVLRCLFLTESVLT